MPGKSSYELLQSPPHEIPEFASWLNVWDFAVSRPLAPMFMLGNISASLSQIYFNETGNLEAGVYTLRDVGVVGSGFIIRDGESVACNAIGLSVGQCLHSQKSGDIALEKKQKISKINKAVMLVTLAPGVYGHWIVDFLPKIALLKIAGFDIHNLTYLIGSSVPEFGLRWLALLGIRPDQILRYDEQSEFVMVEELLVPTNARAGSRTSGVFRQCIDEMMALVDRFAPNSDAGPQYEKVFISRSRAGRDDRFMTNRDEIEGIAREHGYHIVHPEKLPILDQINLFRSAKSVIGEYGSALHGTIFSAPGIDVCCLRAASEHPRFLQSGLCQAMGQQCGYVFGDAPIDAIDVEFSIDTNDFRLALRLLSLRS